MLTRSPSRSSLGRIRARRSRPVSSAPARPTPQRRCRVILDSSKGLKGVEVPFGIQEGGRAPFRQHSVVQFFTILSISAASGAPTEHSDALAASVTLVSKKAAGPGLGTAYLDL